MSILRVLVPRKSAASVGFRAGGRIVTGD
jgi:hypothetical protein